MCQEALDSSPQHPYFRMKAHPLATTVAKTREISPHVLATTFAPMASGSPEGYEVLKVHDMSGNAVGRLDEHM